MSTKRFTNLDGTDSPENLPGWTIQETAVNPGESTSTRVFTSPDKAASAANVRGWTVQDPAIGSDQKTVTGS